MGPAGARFVPPTSPPTPCARTTSRLAGTPLRRKSSTRSRWNTAAPMTRPTSAVCVSRATPASRRSTATRGGRPRGSTPTEICATSHQVAPRLRNLEDLHLGADRQTRGNLAALARGLGPLDLYDARTGQWAGPTACKVPESNRVLTLRASSAVPVRDETREVSLCPSGFGFPGDVQVRVKTRSFSSGVLDPSVADVRLPRVNN